MYADLDCRLHVVSDLYRFDMAQRFRHFHDHPFPYNGHKCQFRGLFLIYTKMNDTSNQSSQASTPAIP